MSELRALLESLPSRYVPGRFPRAATFYFSLGEDRYVVRADPSAFTIEPGRLDDADCVCKADPDVFLKILRERKPPGALDLARGRFRTNNPSLLISLAQSFRD